MYTEHQCTGSSATPLASDCTATDVLSQRLRKGAKAPSFFRNSSLFFSITGGMAIPSGEEISRVLKKSFWINELSVHMSYCPYVPYVHQYYFPHWLQGTIVIHK